MARSDLQFIDTNIFLRYLAGDDPDKGRRAYELLQRVEAGEVAVTTTEAVILEIIFVLSGKRTYNRPRAEIREKLVAILSLRGLRLSRKAVYLRALDLYVANGSVDFVDCLNAAFMEDAGIKIVWTFDKDNERIQGVSGLTRREP